ncbi:MAG: hypothetical protein J7K04_09945 [Spirochaetales bacterium]|nr:hypothetical protein [Spirochaetales bacterium]
MVQFYFLSIVANFFGGAALAADYLGAKFPFFESIKGAFEKREVKIGLGFTALIVGIFKLIVKPVGWAVPVAGDLIPALTGITVGLVLLLDFFKQKAGPTKTNIEKVEKTVMTYKMPLGILSIIVAFLHFLFPGALLL